MEIACIILERPCIGWEHSGACAQAEGCCVEDIWRPVYASERFQLVSRRLRHFVHFRPLAMPRLTDTAWRGGLCAAG